MPADARTLAEAYVHLELIMPEGESAPDYRRYSTLTTVDDDTWVLRFDGPYEDLWVTGEVTIDKAADREAERTGQRYGVGRSTLVDAGQWYAVEVTAAANAQDGIERLAAGTADEDTYWMVVDALETAVAATEEIEKFIPPGTDDVPADAFWTDVGRQVGGQRRDALRRLRLRGERFLYLRQLDKVRADHAPRDDAGEPSAVAAPDPAEIEAPDPSAVEPADEPVLTPGPRDGDRETPLPARTFAEAYVFMDACPCVCGSTQFPRAPFDVLAGDETSYVARYAGPCDGCDQPREFVFRFPQRPGTPPESPHRFSFPEDGPSAILDPGDWVGVAEVYGTFADAIVANADLLPEQLTDDDRAVLTRLLSTAAYALDEATRFLPPDADAIPATAFWTDSGRDIHQNASERFDRPALIESRADRWRRFEDFVARYGH